MLDTNRGLVIEKRFELKLAKFTTPFDVYLKFLNAGTTAFSDENYSEFMNAGSELSSQLIDLKKEQGLISVREACDYLVEREMQNQLPEKANEALRLYEDMQWGDLGGTVGEVLLGWEMTGAYHRYLATHAERPLSKAKHAISAITYSANPRWGGFSEYISTMKEMISPLMSPAKLADRARKKQK